MFMYEYPNHSPICDDKSCKGIMSLTNSIRNRSHFPHRSPIPLPMEDGTLAENVFVVEIETVIIFVGCVNKRNMFRRRDDCHLLIQRQKYFLNATAEFDYTTIAILIYKQLHFHTKRNLLCPEQIIKCVKILIIYSKGNICCIN